MAHDRARAADTASWLQKAREDLQITRQLLKGSKALSGGAIFHCQQAAEKALKAFLVWHDVPFRKTHDLQEVGNACVKKDTTLNEVISHAIPLTDYAWKFRYPGEPDRPSRREVEEALTIAAAVYRTIRSRLPKEVKP
jgi:HEPN domain-containing protein